MPSQGLLDALRIETRRRCGCSLDAGRSQGLLDALRIETLVALLPTRMRLGSQGLLDALRIETAVSRAPRIAVRRHKGCSMPYESRRNRSG